MKKQIEITISQILRNVITPEEATDIILRLIAGCPKCGSNLIQTSHGPYCPYASCKWGWETEIDGSPLLVSTVESELLSRIKNIEKELTKSDCPPCQNCRSTDQKIVQANLQFVCNHCDLSNSYYTYGSLLNFMDHIFILSLRKVEKDIKTQVTTK